MYVLCVFSIVEYGVNLKYYTINAIDIGSITNDYAIKKKINK